MIAKPLTGTLLGYDPGGNGGHGVAALRLDQGRCIGISTQSLNTAQDVIDWAVKQPDMLGMGIDTLTYWATGPSGWRPADLWLRQTCRKVMNSVVSPNGMYGSMGLNGMSVLIRLRKTGAHLPICETHPKVLYHALTGDKYSYQSAPDRMDADLSAWLGQPITTANDHEWDAAISAYALWQGLAGQWTRDLANLPVPDGAELVWPAGRVHYWWP